MITTKSMPRNAIRNILDIDIVNLLEIYILCNALIKPSPYNLAKMTGGDHLFIYLKKNSATFQMNMCLLRNSPSPDTITVSESSFFIIYSKLMMNN